MVALLAAICLATGIPDNRDEGGLIIPPLAEPTLPVTAPSAAGFAPAGWRVEREIRGDLNKDGRPDLVAVLKGVDPGCVIRTELSSEPMDTNPRLLLVAFGTPQAFTRQVANTAIIPRQEDPFVDDPLDNGDLSIRAGVLRLKLGHWRSAGGWGTYTNALAFRWDGSAFRLIGFDKDHLQRNSGETEKLSVNFLTRRARIATGSIADDAAEKAIWTTVTGASPPPLETFGDGLSFEPELRTGAAAN